MFLNTRMANNDRCERRQSAFTLIELLIVIAIIALLAAILFPVFSTAREKARESTCMSNLKQLSLGILQYCGDFDERLPYAIMEDGGVGTVAGNSGYRWYWEDAIYPYVKSSGVYSCPDTSPGAGAGLGIWPYQPISRSLPGGRHTGGGPYGGYTGSTGSFIANSTYYGGAPGNSPIPLTPDLGGSLLPPVNLASVAAPATTLLVMDGACVGACGSGGDSNAMWITWQYGIAGANNGPTLVTTNGVTAILGGSGTTAGGGAANYPVAGSAVARHMGFIAAAFADGHVKAMRPEVLMEKSTTNFLNGNPAQPSYKYWTNQDD